MDCPNFDRIICEGDHGGRIKTNVMKFGKLVIPAYILWFPFFCYPFGIMSVHYSLSGIKIGEGCRSLLESCIGIVLYVILLLVLFFIFRLFRRGYCLANLNMENSCRLVCEISKLALLLTAVQLFIMSRCFDIIFAQMGIILITLYLGFRVSLEDLFTLDKLSDLFNKRKEEQLDKVSKLVVSIPFWLSLAFAIPMIIFDKIRMTIILCLIVVLIVLTGFQFIQWKAQMKFCKEVIQNTQNKHILLLQSDSEDNLAKRLASMLNSSGRSVSEIQCFSYMPKYDLIIDIAADSNIKTEVIKKITNEDMECKIVDPFCSKRGKCHTFLRRLLGIPKKDLFPSSDYIDKSKS